MAITKDICLTAVVFPNRCVPKNTIVDIITKEPNDTKLNCGNLSSTFQGLVILYFPNAQKLLTIKFQTIENSAEIAAVKNGASKNTSENISKEIALIKYPMNPVIAYFRKGE